MVGNALCRGNHGADTQLMTAHMWGPAVTNCTVTSPGACRTEMTAVLPCQVVVDSLYREEGGHECLRDTVQAVVAGVRNPAHLELSINAVQLLTRCGERLAAWEAAGHRDEGPSSRGITTASGVDTGEPRALGGCVCVGGGHNVLVTVISQLCWCNARCAVCVSIHAKTFTDDAWPAVSLWHPLLPFHASRRGCDP